MTEQEIIRLIKQACENRTMCEVQLLQEPSSRIIHPHGYCFTRKYEPVIVCVQVKGYSRSKKLPEFRNLSLERCEEVKVLRQRFSIDPRFNPDDDQYRDWQFHV